MTTIFIPIKHNSQRVPNKNFRLFKGKPLWEHTVDKLKNFKVYVDTDSDQIIKKCDSKPWVKAFTRKKRLIGDDVSVVNLLKSFTLRFKVKDPICQIHVTSPLLDIKHLDFAFQKIKEGFDSVFSADIVQKRFWRKETYGLCPINHNPLKLEQTQDLPEWYCENSYLYAFKPEVLSMHNRIGKNPYVFHVGFPYNVDIDTEEDWELLQRF
ncbi:acylneuraminate cytidylyltransferase family protein [Verrucomicrobia bacterium]|nr:acylneuraminate cytidylyltransferase family protein [Verrucomicrobiota bacterium]